MSRGISLFAVVFVAGLLPAAPHTRGRPRAQAPLRPNIIFIHALRWTVKSPQYFRIHWPNGGSEVNLGAPGR
jgi:hypothetical protein